MRQGQPPRAGLRAKSACHTGQLLPNAAYNAVTWPGARRPSPLFCGEICRMEMFALEHEIAQWESELPSLRARRARTALAVAVLASAATRLRLRASQLGEEARVLLPLAGLDSAALEQAQARLQLVQAELEWLHGELDVAEKRTARRRTPSCVRTATVLAAPTPTGCSRRSRLTGATMSAATPNCWRRRSRRAAPAMRCAPAWPTCYGALGRLARCASRPGTLGQALPC